jgi:hypothetical protein
MNVKEITNYIKPQLPEEFKFKRLQWVLSFIENTTDGIMFNDLQQYVYLDEKWFILQKMKRLLKRFDDSPPENFHHIQSKSNPTQIMCTAAVARPRFSEKSEDYFNGLLCLLSHINWVAAQRNSVNRPRGTLIAQPYTINSENINDGMTMEGGLIESIEDMFRPHINGPIIIQIDNAPGHVGHNNINRLGGYIAQNAIEVEIRLQPPNSPDLNLCDLTFFRSLDRAVYWMKDQAQNIVQLMQVVIGCFEEYDPGTLEHGFGHLFAVFVRYCEFRDPHDHVRERIRNGDPLNYVGKTMEEVKLLINEVNNYFPNEIPLQHL